MNELFRLTDASFPIALIEHRKSGRTEIFDAHAHAYKLQLFYFIQGEASVRCGQRDYNVSKGDVLLINSGEMHAGRSLCEELRYYVFRFDIKQLIACGIEAASVKYFKPIGEGTVFFCNKIAGDAVDAYLDDMIRIGREKVCGYELELMSYVFKIMAELYRAHVKFSYSQYDITLLMAKKKRFADVLTYIEHHYTKSISVERAAEMAGMSVGYFCRMFKKTMGCTFTEHINRVRVERAAVLLNQGLGNITDAAMSVGFDDANYFSRVFKKYMKISPSEFIRNDARFFI